MKIKFCFVPTVSGMLYRNTECYCSELYREHWRLALPQEPFILNCLLGLKFPLSITYLFPARLSGSKNAKNNILLGIANCTFIKEGEVCSTEQSRTEQLCLCTK